MKWKLISSEVTSITTAEGRISLKMLFFPLFIEQLLMNLMGTVNTLTLGHYSDDAVAAVGAANQVMGLVYTFYAVVSGGASIVISHRLGADEPKEASDTAFTSLIFSGMLSIAFSIILAGLTVPVMRLLHLEGEILQMAASYFCICIGSSFLQGLITSASAILRSYGKPRIAVTISLIMNIINAFLDVVIVFRPFEIPLHGVTGIAVANVISRMIALIAIMICLAKANLNLQFRSKNIRTIRCIRSILKIGLPGGVSSLSYSLSQVVSTSILAILGTVALSTKIYISSIVFYVYVTGMSLGISTAILMGWMTGAGEHEKAYNLNQQVLKLAISLNMMLSILVFVCYKPLISLFTDNQEIISMTRIILFIDIFVEIGRAFNHIEDNSLRGAGDVVFPMVVAITSCWMMSILFSYILGIRLGWGLTGCWIAFMMDELFRGLIFWRRFRSKRWMSKHI